MAAGATVRLSPSVAAGAAVRLSPSVAAGATVRLSPSVAAGAAVRLSPSVAEGAGNGCEMEYSRDVTPPLGCGEREEAAAAAGRQPGGILLTRDKRQSLALSLRKGKKRVCGDCSAAGSQLLQPPSSKKARVDQGSSSQPDNSLTAVHPEHSTTAAVYPEHSTTAVHPEHSTTAAAAQTDHSSSQLDDNPATTQAMQNSTTALVPGHSHTAAAALIPGHSHTATTALIPGHSHTATAALIPGHSHTATTALIPGHSHTATTALIPGHSHTATAALIPGHSHTATAALIPGHSHTATAALIPDHSHTATAEGLHDSSVACVQTDHSALNFLTLEAATQSLSALRQTEAECEGSKVPDMFAPEGMSPATYTATILSVFNSYISQLCEAQAQVVSRVAWGNAVPAHYRQSITTLIRHPSPPRQAPGWPTIDLRTGEIIHHSPLSLSGSRKRARRRLRRTSFAEEEEDEDFVSVLEKGQHWTPVRNTHKARVSGREWFVPANPPLHTRAQASQTVSVTARSATPDSPPAATPAKLHPPLVNSDPSAEMPQESCSLKPTVSQGEVDKSVPDALSLSTAEGTREEMGCETGEEVEGGQVSSKGEEERQGSSEGEEERQGSSEGEEKRQGSSEGETGTAEARGQLFYGVKRRKRAKILEDSDSEEEAECGIISSQLNDVTASKNSTAKHAQNGARESERTSESIFTRLMAATGRGRRAKRQSFQQLPVRTVRGRKNCSAAADSVIDLTEEVRQAAEGGDQPASDHGPQQELVPCPLCSGRFPPSLIETHAASCLEEEEEEESSPPHLLPLRQSTLLTPRFKK